MNIKIDSFGSMGILGPRKFTVNLESDFPDPSTLADVKDCFSLCRDAESTARYYAGFDNTQEDQDARVGHFLWERRVGDRDGMTPNRERTVVVAARVEGAPGEPPGSGLPTRLALRSAEGDIQSDRTYKDGKVQSVFEKRLLASGQAEILTVQRNGNGTITVTCELTDGPRAVVGGAQGTEIP